jgi:hypothetical protein
MLKFSILFTVFSTALFGVYDVTKYLENHKFDIEIKDNNLVKYSPGINSFPSYLAKDAYGRQFEFFFYPNWKIEQQLAIQQIFEILGVPTKIKYPTIIRLNGKFQSIMVSPIIPTAQANVNNVDVIEMANRTKMTLTYYLLGVVGFEATSSPEGFVVNDTILPFAQYNARENKRPKLDTYLRTTKIQGNGTVVVPNLREIDSQTRAKFLLEMSLYFRKLAALTAKDSKGQSLLLKIFESYISQNTHSVEKLNTQIGPFTPKRSEFQEKAEGLKLEFENFLKEQVKGAFVVEPIRWIEYGDAKPVADFLYHIPQVLPYSTKLLPDISNEQERRKTAKTHLLRWILTNENTREFALKEWKKQIPPTEEDAIELLMEEARVYDNTVTAVTSARVSVSHRQSVAGCDCRLSGATLYRFVFALSFASPALRQTDGYAPCVPLRFLDCLTPPTTAFPWSAIAFAQHWEAIGTATKSTVATYWHRLRQSDCLSLPVGFCCRLPTLRRPW